MAVARNLLDAFSKLWTKGKDKQGSKGPSPTPSTSSATPASGSASESPSSKPEAVNAAGLDEDVKRRWRRGCTLSHAENFKSVDPHQFDGEILPQDCEYKGMRGQWMTRAHKWSSQYSDRWAISKCLGKANVFPRHGDNEDAWAPASSRGTMEFIWLRWDHACIVSSVEIYETYNSGGCVKIELEAAANEDGTAATTGPGGAGRLETVWERPLPQPAQVAAVFRPPLRALEHRTIGIRITMDTSQNYSWGEIDAVRIFSLNPLRYIEDVPTRAPESLVPFFTLMLCCRRKWDVEEDENYYLPREMWDHIARHLSTGSVAMTETTVANRIITPTKPPRTDLVRNTV